MSRAAARAGGRAATSTAASGAPRRAGATPAGGKTRKPMPAAGKVAASGYLADSERPWASLLFVLPLVLVYEAYVLGWFGQATQVPGRPSEQIIAFLLLEQLFALLGAAGRHLPALALVAMLLAAHVVRKDRWHVKPVSIGAMAIESIVWTIPLIVLGWVMSRFVPLAGGGSNAALISKCLGAGIYEEMLFRLIGMTVLSLILKDVLGLPNWSALGIVLLASGVLFSLYHYLSPDEHFRLRTFVFRTLAGGFFGLLFVLRGFGITAGSHAAYDLIVVLVLAR